MGTWTDSCSGEKMAESLQKERAGADVAEKYPLGSI